ncbi:MAG: hypothetical protein QOK26_3856 [Pseudonocardiales bacterium]|jgi:hypothetical protein|nr:hypothetical protein [Pseudonocardiales bacterium]
MPHYLVERTFPDGLAIPTDDEGAKACLNVVDGNAVHDVSWVALLRQSGPDSDLLHL